MIALSNTTSMASILNLGAFYDNGMIKRATNSQQLGLPQA